MASSVQPISSAAWASLVWEVDSNAESVFGASPLNAGSVAPILEASIFEGRLGRALTFMRERVVPRVLSSLNSSQLTLVHRSASNVSGDPLGKTHVQTVENIYGAISGPSIDDLETGLMSKADFKVLVPAYTLGQAITDDDAVRIDGLDYDVVELRAHPKTPGAVAYSFVAKRAV